MARQDKEYRGLIVGKLGPVVGVRWRDKHLLRSLPKKRTNKPSEKQLLQQYKMKLVAQFIAPLRSIINNYYPSSSSNNNGVNITTSQVLKNGIDYNHSSPKIHYSSFVFTLGVLPNTGSSIERKADTLSITWLPLPGGNLHYQEDFLHLVFYHPLTETWYQFHAIASRADLTSRVVLPSALKEAEIHIWQFWTQEDTKQNSTSLYLGKH